MPIQSYAAPVFPLATDQSECFDGAGKRIPCRGSGQDGEFSPLRNRIFPRFEDQGTVVADRITGRTWLKNAAFDEFPLTWEEALEAIAAMNRQNTCGFGDWRLPSRREIYSLVSHARINPALPAGHPFENVFSGYYWSSTPCARLPGQAWNLHMGGARLAKELKSRSAMVWPVRSACAPAGGETLGQFHNLEGAAADLRTGLLWLKAADLCRGPVTWESALAAVHELNQKRHLGRATWRLPNIREIESLVDDTRHSPALPEGHPFAAVKDGYWSATTSAYERRYAWVLYLMDGLVGVGFKAHPEFYIWPVTEISPS